MTTSGLNGIFGIFGIMTSDKPLLSLVLGIRPDVIRANLLISILRKELGESFEFVWSGQHYSSNMKDVFFEDLQVPKPDVELRVDNESDTSFLASMQIALDEYIRERSPSAIVFLGDTNTVLGSVIAAIHNVPIIHIEGCMRSYNWEMPEEKNRTVIDHLSDRIYAYLDEYKAQGVAEGIPEAQIQVTGNPIVDVLERQFIDGMLRVGMEDLSLLRESHGVNPAEKFVVMTIHRRENITKENSLRRILSLAEAAEHKVIFFAGYATQRYIKEFDISVPDNIFMFDPTGYKTFTNMMYESEFIISDSGTVIEEASILGVPSVQVRKSTERPQVYDWESSVRFDPEVDQETKSFKEDNGVIDRVLKKERGSWSHQFGDGFASERIAEDLINRLRTDSLKAVRIDHENPLHNRAYSE